MKYIVTEDEQFKEEIFLFPNSVNHACFAEVISGIRNQKHGNWKRTHRIPVSAGFVTGGVCHGKSESLNMTSRASDNDVLKAQQNENN